MNESPRCYSNCGEDEEDAVCGAYLDLLERDIAAHPGRIRPLTRELAGRMRRLTAGIEVDLKEAIQGRVAL